jgi:hypothetical protein
MGEILLLIVLFAVGGLLQATGKRRRQGSLPSSPPPELEPPGSGSLMDEFQNALEEMKRANEAAASSGTEEEAEIEAATREIEAEVRNLDEVVPRPERTIVDQDDSIEALTARRAEWAEARSKSHTKADHQAFDAKIRAVESAAPAGPDRAAALRRMVVWQEVLGKPVALRRREDR